MTKVTSKKRMFNMYLRYQFGNRFKVWESIESFKRDTFLHITTYGKEGFDGLVGVRCLGKPGLPYLHHLSPFRAIQEAEKLARDYDVEVAIFEASPDEHIIFQGEIVETNGSLEGIISREKADMRTALSRETIYIRDTKAYFLLKKYLYGASFDELIYLLNTFPEHVIEFTIYDICVGEFKGRNAIWWEVRYY